MTFAVGQTMVLVGITYGIQPYGSHTMGWTSPFVLSMILGGIALLLVFAGIEQRAAAQCSNYTLPITVGFLIAGPASGRRGCGGQVRPHGGRSPD